MQNRVYLDCNATCPVRPEVVQTVSDVLQVGGNASSVHAEGRKARSTIEKARSAVARTVDAGNAQIIFTSGATEANNWAMFNRDPVFVSAIEHPSILDLLSEEQHRRQLIPVTSKGLIDLSALEAMLEDHPAAMVAVMLANNETGIIQPVREVADLCTRYGARLHVDAVQALGKISFSFQALGCDSMSLSAHKLGGPPGVGALIVGAEMPMPAMIKGGGQEKRLRSGTENLAGIAGFHACIEAANSACVDDLGAWHHDFEAHILDQIPDAIVVGANALRLPNTSCILIPGIEAEITLMAADLEGIAISSGAACSSGKVAPSHVLTAMGIDADKVRTAIRVSSGWNNDRDDFDRLVGMLTTLHARFSQDK